MTLTTHAYAVRQSIYSNFIELNENPLQLWTAIIRFFRRSLIAIAVEPNLVGQLAGYSDFDGKRDAGKATQLQLANHRKLVTASQAKSETNHRRSSIEICLVSSRRVESPGAPEGCSAFTMRAGVRHLFAHGPSSCHHRFEVVSCHLPGHENRFREAPVLSIDELVGNIISENTTVS